MFIKQWPTFEIIALWVLTALIILAPLLFLPILGLTIDVGKTLILSFGIIAVLILWLISLLQESHLTLPKTIGLLAPVPLLVGLLISALFSGAIRFSLYGSGYEHGTVWFWLVLSLVFGLSAIIFQSKERVIRVCLGLLAASILVFLFQALLIIFGPFNWLAIFSTKTVNLIGKWNELAVFFGLIATMAVSIWELVPPKGSKVISYLVRVSLITSLIALAFINFYRVWLVLAVLSLILFIYLIVMRERSNSGEHRRIIRPVFIVLVVAIIFLTIGQTSNVVGRGLNLMTIKLGVNSIEVWPTESATWAVFKQAIIKDPLLGVGPGQFTNSWLVFKPSGVNNSPFWAVDFDAASGYLPTFLITAGGVGLLGVLAFLLLFGFGIIRNIFTVTTDKSGHSLALVILLVTVYGWIFSLFYVPSAALLIITMALSGMSFGVLVAIKRLPIYELFLAHNPRINFISILVIIFSLILSIGAGYLLIQKMVSIYWFQQGLSLVQNGKSVDEVEPYFLAAANWSDSEIYERALADVGLAKISLLLSSNNETSPETVRAQFEGLLSTTLIATKRAIDHNPNNYLNWIALARVYESLVPLKIPGAYEQAVATYAEVAKRNPTSPAIDLLLARLELALNDRKAAREHLLTAVAKKANYTDALFLLAQLDVESGNLKEAIIRAENAVLLSPNDGGIFFQLGFLRYRAGDYVEARQALTRATDLISNYANAQYFLGLAESALGNRQAAINQFEAVAALNPGNAEVKSILANLRAGRAPFATGTKDTPEKRSTPPVKDN
ncbi:MAG: tetratricopeptide repeat protein [Candidatus Vogelbacteria bacterium]|nr:tetratricopeptide repeat protein [Candidatus Vogelbacteria bacterium]